MSVIKSKSSSETTSSFLNHLVNMKEQRPFTVEECKEVFRLEEQGLIPNEILKMIKGTNQFKENHGLSRTIAKEHGINAAILLKFLGYKLRRSKHVIDGMKWFYLPIDDFATKCPYLARATIHDTFTKLTINGVLVKGRYNKWSKDRTTWYAFANHEMAKTVDEDLIYFNVKTAEKHGVNESILLNNMAYWIKENQKKDSAYEYHPMSPYELAKILPLTRSAIQRTLKKLVENNVLALNPTPKGKASEYRFFNETLDSVIAEALPYDKDEAETTTVPDLETENPVKASQSSKPDAKTPYSDKGSLYLDKNSAIVDKSNDTFHTKSIPETATNPIPEIANSFPDNTNPEPDSINSLPDGINPMSDSTNPVPDDTSSKPDMTNSFADMTNPFPDNNTHYKTITRTLIRSLTKPITKPLLNHLKSLYKNNYKESSAAPSSFCFMNTETENGKCESNNKESIQSLTRRVAKMYLDLKNGKNDELSTLVYELANIFIISMPENKFIHYYKLGSREKVYALVCPIIDSFVETDLDADIDVGYYVVLDCLKCWISNGIFKGRFTNEDILMPTSGFSALLTVIINRWDIIEAKFKAQEYAKIIEQANPEYERLMNMSNDGDENRRNVDLTPKEKVNMLKEYLDVQKQIGSLPHCEGTVRALLIYKSNDLKAAERLFKENPHLAASHLTDIMEYGLDMLQNDPEYVGKYDPSYHLRRSYDLRFFLNHFEKIANSIPDSEFPEINYLTYEELFPEAVKYAKKRKEHESE